MVGISSIFPFFHPLDFDSIHVVDQDSIDFDMIDMTNLTIHDNFIWPCNHVDPY